MVPGNRTVSTLNTAVERSPMAHLSIYFNHLHRGCTVIMPSSPKWSTLLQNHILLEKRISQICWKTGIKMPRILPNGLCPDFLTCQHESSSYHEPGLFSFTKAGKKLAYGTYSYILWLSEVVFYQVWPLSINHLSPKMTDNGCLRLWAFPLPWESVMGRFANTSSCLLLNPSQSVSLSTLAVVFSSYILSYALSPENFVRVETKDSNWGRLQANHVLSPNDEHMKLPYILSETVSPPRS